jgi:D-inositol-3-phosphate glycosyltransferase
VQPGVDLGVFSPLPDADLVAEPADGAPVDGDPVERARQRAERRAERRAELRERLGLPADRKIVLFAGRVQLLKGPDVLVRALGERIWSAEGGQPPLLVVLGGASGRPTAVRELEALAYQEGVAPHVRVRPPVPQQLLADYFRAADLVAVPSHSESFGLVAAEAQASGTPVVAAAVGGLRTVVQDGVSGVLVPDHEPVSWALALKTLLDDDELRAHLATGARASATRFGWDRAADEILGVYEQARKYHATR